MWRQRLILTSILTSNEVNIDLGYYKPQMRLILDIIHLKWSDVIGQIHLSMWQYIIVWLGDTVAMLDLTKCYTWVMLAWKTTHIRSCKMLSNWHSLIHTLEKASMTSVQLSCLGTQRRSLTLYLGYDTQDTTINSTTILGQLHFQDKTIDLYKIIGQLPFLSISKSLTRRSYHWFRKLIIGQRLNVGYDGCCPDTSLPWWN